jgi:hypothetical protein
MIRETRKKHRFIWLAFAILLPVLFAASVIYRHSEPLNQVIPQTKNK